MDRAAADEMDVVNMSLGDAFATWPDYPDAAAADALTDAGTLVVASAGNSGESGLFSSGSPGVGKKVISVASVENTNITNDYIAVTPSPAGTDGNFVYCRAEGAPLPPTPGGTADLARASVQHGCTAFTGVAGKIVLIQRGTCCFDDKALNAQSAGASRRWCSTTTQPGILSPDRRRARSDHDSRGHDRPGRRRRPGAQLGTTPTTLTWTSWSRRHANPVAGLVSDFSSFGMAADLTLTPDVAAPGGNIWSTYPIEQNSYANLSGTSMAAPHVTGVGGPAAAGRAAGQRRPAGGRDEGAGGAANTAKPISSLFQFGLPVVPGVYEPTVRQGAGLIQVDKAIAAALTSTTITPGKISVGENRSQLLQEDADPHQPRHEDGEVHPERAERRRRRTEPDHLLVRLRHEEGEGEVLVEDGDGEGGQDARRSRCTSSSRR